MELLSRNVEELELSVRSANCLKSGNIKTLYDLVTKPEQEMLKFRNFGRKSLNEIGEILEGMDLELRHGVPVRDRRAVGVRPRTRCDQDQRRRAAFGRQKDGFESCVTIVSGGSWPDARRTAR